MEAALGSPSRSSMEAAIRNRILRCADRALPGMLFQSVIIRPDFRRRRYRPHSKGYQLPCQPFRPSTTPGSSPTRCADLIPPPRPLRLTSTCPEPYLPGDRRSARRLCRGQLSDRAWRTMTRISRAGGRQPVGEQRVPDERNYIATGQMDAWQPFLVSVPVEGQDVGCC
jgi:hypothetical protein